MACQYAMRYWQYWYSLLLLPYFIRIVVIFSGKDNTDAAY